MTDFVVDSQGGCFLCLASIKVKGEEDPDDDEEFLEESAVTPPPPIIYSIQYLSRYLKLDVKQVFIGKDLPHRLVSKIARSKFSVELCEGCACLCERFSELYQKLEGIRMEMEAQVKLIHGKLLISNKGKSKPFQEPGVMEGLEVAGILRTETLQKCRQRLKTVLPRVKLRVRQLAKAGVGVDDHRKETSHQPSQPQRQTMVVKSHLKTMECPICHSQVPHLTSHLYSHIENSQPLQHDSLKLTMEVIPPSPEGQAKLDEIQKQCSLDPTTGRYKCNECPKQFKEMKTFKPHYQSNHVGLRYKCTLCGKKFRRRDNYTLHHQNFHMGVRFKCDLCEALFPRKIVLRKHFEKEHITQDQDLRKYSNDDGGGHGRGPNISSSSPPKLKGHHRLKTEPEVNKMEVDESFILPDESDPLA